MIEPRQLRTELLYGTRSRIEDADVVAKFDPRFQVQESFGENVSGLPIRTIIVNRDGKFLEHFSQPMHIDPVCSRNVSNLC